MRTRMTRAEKNAEFVVMLPAKLATYILVALDKVRKVCYSFMNDLHQEKTARQIRSLVEVEESGMTKLCKGDEITAMFPAEPSLHNGVCYPVGFPGLRLYPNEYEFVLEDSEFAKLLEGSND